MIPPAEEERKGYSNSQMVRAEEQEDLACPWPGFHSIQTQTVLPSLCSKWD